MNIINKETLDAILETIASDTPLSEQILPWNHLGEDVVKLLAGPHGHPWPKVPMAGYCMPFVKPVTVKGSNDLYRLCFVAHYSYYTNRAVDVADLDYTLYIEGETEHMNIALTGWTLGRRLGEPCVYGEVSKGIVDYDRRVIFNHYTGIRQRMEQFSRLLMEREVLRGDSYLACFATHHYNEVYRDTPYPEALQEICIPTDRTLNNIIWGK